MTTGSAASPLFSLAMCPGPGVEFSVLRFMVGVHSPYAKKTLQVVLCGPVDTHRIKKHVFHCSSELYKLSEPTGSD